MKYYYTVFICWDSIESVGSLEKEFSTFSDARDFLINNDNGDGSVILYTNDPIAIYYEDYRIEYKP